MEKLESIWQFDEVIAKAMSERGYNSYYKELYRLLNLYRSLLKRFTLNKENVLYEDAQIGRYVKKQIPKLNHLFDYYSKGKLAEFDKIAESLFNTQSNRISVSTFFPITTIEKDSIWYRARKPEMGKKYIREELYHVPFQKRGFVGNDRFSINGFPCLYLGNTLKCVDAETPPSAIKAVSCFKTMQDLDVYDFTFFSSKDKLDNTRVINNLLSYPFKIAASIPFKMEDKVEKGDKYIPEYVIPQLLLHWTIRNIKGKKPKGILYSSTKAITDKVNITGFSEYINMVVPSFFIKEKGLCSFINTYFQLTEPEIVAFPYLDDESIVKVQNEMQKKEFNQIDIDYEPKN